VPELRQSVLKAAARPPFCCAGLPGPAPINRYFNYLSNNALSTNREAVTAVTSRCSIAHQAVPVGFIGREVAIVVLVKKTGSRPARWFVAFTEQNKTRSHWYDVAPRGM
jgi:hypothetical protein